ncbi:MAG: insulinase family protein [Candidatus Rokubacteria bacterium]|nr:insulinase family protein [Candidatus Rokubacteria bacterium]
MVEQYRKSVLPNGIRVVTERMPHVRSVAVGIWVDTGSRNEPASRGGVSHLIEHLVFKGTASRTAADIARTMDSVGGQMDAFTAKEHTCFYVSVLDEHLPLAVDLLTDILLHPLFGSDDIEREKSVVLQEIKMVEDTPDDLVHDLFAERVWAGHALGRPILGRREVVQGFSREVILSHFGEEYVPGRIVIAVAGHVEHEQVVSLFASRFEGFDRPAVARDGSPPVVHGGVEMVPKNLEQVHMVAGLPGLCQSAPERYALYLLNDVIGGSMSSRLFQEVRERQGLVYSIYSGTQAYRDTGVLYIYAATDAANFSKVLKSVLKEVRGLKKEGTAAEELRRAKDHLKGNLMLSLESTSSRMNRLAKQELYFGSFFSLDEMLAAIDRVKEEEVQALVDRLLDEEQIALLTLGPLDRRHLPREFVRH